MEGTGAQREGHRFTLELPLVTDGGQERLLEVRFRIACYAYNAILRECLRRLLLMRGSRRFHRARVLGDRRERRRALRALLADFGLSKYELQPWVAQHVTHTWLGKHLGALSGGRLCTGPSPTTSSLWPGRS